MYEIKNRKAKIKSANFKYIQNSLIQKFYTQTILITACALCLGIVAKELSFHSRMMCKARRIHIPTWSCLNTYISEYYARSPPICTYVRMYIWGFLIQMAAAGSVINGSGVYRAQCRASERATCAAALILKPAAVLFSSPSAPCIHERARTHPFARARIAMNLNYIYMSAFMMFLLLTHSVDSTRALCALHCPSL